MAQLLPPVNLLRRGPDLKQPILDAQEHPSWESEAAEKKKKTPPLLGAPPDSLADLRGPEDLQRYNLDALKKIARMGAVTLPKIAPRAVCVERLTGVLFGAQNSVEYDEEDVHTVNLSCHL
jgi:hypothetical protein